MKIGLLLSLALLCGLTGCASRQVSDGLDHLGIVQKAPDLISLSGVGIVSEDGRKLIRAGMRFRGKKATRIRWADTSIAASVSHGNAEMRLIYPNKADDELSDILASQAVAIDSEMKRAARVARSIVEDMKLLAHRPVIFHIFTSPFAGGYMLDVDSEIDNGPIQLLVARPSSESLDQTWWISALKGAIHELTHVHQGLFLVDGSGPDPASKYRTNWEVAASLSEKCAELDFIKDLTKEFNATSDEPNYEPLITTWPVLELTDTFPGLRERYFDPNMQALEALAPNHGSKGVYIAEAVMYLLSDNGEVNVNDSDQNQVREQYCSYIYNNTPDFAAGDYLGELDSF